MVYIRAVVLYLILILVIRLMGKRQIGQMEPSEFVVTMLIANLASVPVEDVGVPLYTGVIPMFTVLGVEWVLSVLCLRSIRIRKLLCGKPVILIDNGRILQQNLRKTTVTIDELTESLREKNILDLKTVQFAILETSGKLSVFPYPKDRPASAQEAGIKAVPQYLPVTIISDGRLLKHNLSVAQKDTAWVEKQLKAHHTTQKDTWLMTVDAAGHVLWYRKER